MSLLEALSRLLGVHSKLTRAMARYAALAKESEGELQKRYPQVRIDRPEYDARMRRAKREIDAALEEEKELKTLFAAWVEKNFTSREAQRVRVNPGALGIARLSGVEIPLEAIANLGDGSLSVLLSKLLSLNSRVGELSRLIGSLEKTRLATLEAVREALKSHGEPYAQAAEEISGLIAEGRAALPAEGFSSEAVLWGLWTALKIKKLIAPKRDAS